MVRYTFGGSAVDLLVNPDARGVLRTTSGDLRIWDDRVGGSQVTDLRLNGSPVETIPVGVDGLVPLFEGPDGETEIWIEADAARVRLYSTDGLDQIAPAVAATGADRVATAALRNESRALRDDQLEISGLTGEDAAVSYLIGDAVPGLTPPSLLRQQLGKITQPRVLVVNTVGDGVTDDRATINNALLSIPNDGKRWTVYCQGQTQFISPGPVSAGLATGVVIPRDDITLVANLYSTADNMRLLVACGIGKASPTNPIDTAQWVTSQPITSFTGPVNAGVRVLPPLAAAVPNLAVGDYVFLATGQCINGSGREPDSELNRVAALSTDGKTVTLFHPTSKPYAQEYETGEAGGVSSTTGGGAAKRFGLVRVPPGQVIRGFKFVGSVRADTGGASNSVGLYCLQAWDVDTDGASFTGGKYAIAARYTRALTGTHNLRVTGASDDNDPAYIHPSTGCTAWDTVSKCSGDVAGKVAIHEGVADCKMRFVIRQPDGPGQASAANVSCRGRNYNIDLWADVEGVYTATGCKSIQINDDCDVTVHQARVRGASPTTGSGATLSFGAKTKVRGGAVDVNPGAVTFHTTAAAYPFGETVPLLDTAGYAAGANPLPTYSGGSNTTLPGWLMFDGATNASIHGVIFIPPAWKRWVLEWVSTAVGAPTAGSADTVRWQTLTAPLPGSTVTSPQVSAVYAAAATPVTTRDGVTAQQITTGYHRVGISRVGSSVSDTLVGDSRIIQLRAVRLA